jgi:NADH-quinone oxidoreductase subunit J
VLRRGFTKNLPFGILIALVLLAEVIVAVTAWKAGPTLSGAAIPATATPNIVALGQLLYSRYLFAFELAGLILLVAMVGAIVLTHRSRGDTRTPKASRQLRRRPQDAVHLAQPEVGEGVQL